ncbi:MAG: hypothetical protein U5L74_09350 [Ideonella sp.]|nr:hypothetical protein [Ideonella sp.]
MTALPLLRRQNALALFHAFAERALASGQAPKGLEQAFAASVQISPSLWSQIKSSRPIGDKLARQIEVHAQQAPGWLDAPHETATPGAAEKAFLALALQAWRATNSAGRKALHQQMTAAVASVELPSNPVS